MEEQVSAISLWPPEVLGVLGGGGSLFCDCRKAAGEIRFPWFVSLFFCHLFLWFEPSHVPLVNHDMVWVWYGVDVGLCTIMPRLFMFWRNWASFLKLQWPSLQYIKSLKKKKRQKRSKVPSFRAESGCLPASRVARLSTMFSCLGKCGCEDISPWIKTMWGKKEFWWKVLVKSICLLQYISGSRKQIHTGKTLQRIFWQRC